jgi:hypothetical protein
LQVLGCPSPASEKVLVGTLMATFLALDGCGHHDTPCRTQNQTNVELGDCLIHTSKMATRSSLPVQAFMQSLRKGTSSYRNCITAVVRMSRGFPIKQAVFMEEAEVVAFGKVRLGAMPKRLTGETILP